MNEHLTQEQPWKQGQLQLARGWGYSCFVLGLLAMAAPAFLPRPLAAGLSRVTRPLSAFFHYEIDVPFLMLGAAVVWLGLGIYFFGREGEMRLEAKAQAAREEKRRQRQEAENYWATIDRFLSSEQAPEPEGDATSTWGQGAEHDGLP